MYAYAAFYGEYEEPYPIGIYDTLTKAKKAVKDSNPTYNTEVIKYNLITGKKIHTYLYQVSDKEWRQE